MVKYAINYMSKRHIYIFIGTTAELVKLALVIKEFKKRKVDFKIITSGQNTIKLNKFKSIIGTQSAYYNFKQKPTKLPLHILFGFIWWSIKAMVNYFLYFRNEFKQLKKKEILFIVHGDTMSSLIGAIISKLHGIQLIHIESGLRSFNFLEPFPEELCRFLVSKLADIHFCPNSWSVNNLRNKKGIKINTFNNTLIETLFATLKIEKKSKNNKILSKRFFLLVLHRQEHVLLFQKKMMKKYLRLLTSFSSNNLKCILVLHKLTEKFLEQENLMFKVKENKNIILIPRLPYADFIRIMSKAEFIATDGGSNQEEAYYLGKPCLILRNVTERTEGLGENAVLSYGNEKIIRDFIQNYKRFKRKPVQFKIPPSKIIVDYLLSH